MEFIGNIQEMVGEAKLNQQKEYLLEGKGKAALSIRRGQKEVYVPYPKQILFHKSHESAWETLYGGAAGGGKSFSMLWDAYMFCIKNPGVRTILFRRTFPQLEKSLIFYSRMIFDSSMGKYNTREKTWTIFTGGKPSYITFGHCKNEADVYGYQSAQYDAMYFDELTHWTEFQYTYLLTRLRPNVPGVKTYVKAASNPGGIGHAWVRRRWRLWDKSIQFQVYRPDMADDEAVRVPSRCFVPAFVQDNLYIMKNDPGYIDRLKSSPYAKQLLEGDWGVFSGQAFSEIDSTKHFQHSFPIPPNWERWVSIDYGYSRPFSAHWHAREPETGRIYTYREIYGAGIKEMDQAKRIVAASMVQGQPERILYHVADPSVFTPRGSGSSIADIWSKNGLITQKGNRDRLSGKARVHDYLSIAADGKPFWIIFGDKCPHLIRTLPELVLDETNPEDVDTRQEDHAYDDCRYFLMSIQAPKRLGSSEIDEGYIDEGSKKEWDWFRKYCKQVSAGDNRALGSGINDVKI